MQPIPQWKTRVKAGRGKALELVGLNPEAMMLTVRYVLKPLQALRRRQYNISGIRWETQQRAKVAKAIQAGRPGERLRQYRIVIAAQCAFENKFMEDLRCLMGPSRLWNALPYASRTVQHRGTTFKLLARSGALVKQLLMIPQSRADYMI